MQQLTTEQLKEKMQNGENFVLDLYATWCGPCKIMLSNLEKVNESLIKESTGTPTSLQNVAKVVCQAVIEAAASASRAAV